MVASRLAALATGTFLLAALTGNITSAQQPAASAPQPLAKRIAQTDRSKMTHVDRRHDGAPGASMCYDIEANQLVIPMNANNALAFVPLKE
jgi:hypothetical protein